MYAEIEIERGDEGWDTEKETEKEAKSDHRNHKDIEKNLGPINTSKFF